MELRKTNTLRDRLEELCRQLQRENRDILEESKRRQEEELKQRQAIQQKFSQAIEVK
jgi:hexokinase